jgi:hypothetical protein
VREEQRNESNRVAEEKLRMENRIRRQTCDISTWNERIIGTALTMSLKTNSCTSQKNDETET